MAWPTNYETDSDVGKHLHVEAFRRAVLERERAIGNQFWPRGNGPFADGFGTIESLVANDDGTYTLTDSTKHWLINDEDHEDAPRWTDWTDPDVDPNTVPEHYDVILNGDDDDITRHLHLRVQFNDDQTLKIAGGVIHEQKAGTPIDFVTAGWLESEAWLVGKSYHIIRRDGWWWGERWPNQPNDDELWVDDADGVTVVRAEPVDEDDGPIAWLRGEFAGRLFRREGEDDVAILDNGIDYLVIERLSEAPDGEFTVVDGEDVLATADVEEVFDGLFKTDMKLRAKAVEGADLLIYAVNNRVKRITIEFAASNLIVFERQDVVVGGPFSVVPPGKRAWPARRPWPLHQWYGGAMDRYYTHLSYDRVFDETVSAALMAASSVTYSSGTIPGLCEEITLDYNDAGQNVVFDADLWSAADEVCSEADFNRSPHLFKTFRGLQNWVTGNCHFFVPTDDYVGKTAIPTYTPATLFERINVNFIGRFTATADVDGNYSFTVTGLPTGPYAPTDYHWTVLRASGAVVTNGFGTAPSLGGATPGDVFTLVVALGWTRYVPREFRAAYPRSAFIPDIVTDPITGARSVVDPPTNKYPGWWEDRDAATSYKRYNQFGFATDDGIDYVAGVRARYVGDNWGDPAITPNTKIEGEDGPLQTLYYRNLWEGRFRKDSRDPYASKKKGFVQYGGADEGAIWFRAKGIHWWDSPIGLQTIRTEAGHATAGSTTTLTDTSKTYIPDPEEGEEPIETPIIIPFWQGGRWVGMMLEVTKTVQDVEDNDVTIVYHTPITAHDEFEVTFMPVPAFTIAEIPATNTEPLVPAIEVPALEVESGDYYEIKEPKYRRNWFAGRTVKLKSPTGETAERIITHHDDDHLWFGGEPVEFELVEGTTWEILELIIGNVYIWQAPAGDEPGKWIDPTDNPRELDQRFLLPKNDKSYGPVMAGDYLGGPVYQELYAALNELVWTLAAVAWTGNPDELESPPGNVAHIEVFDPSDPETYEAVYEGMVANFTSILNGPPPYVPSYADVPPKLAIHGSLNGTSSSLEYDQVAAAAVIAPPAFLARTVEIYAVGLINEDDSEPGPFFAFNPNGVSLSFRNFGVLATLGPSQDLPLKTGLLNAPIAPAVPQLSGEDVAAGGSFYEGFIPTQITALVKWNVPGGMTYLKP